MMVSGCLVALEGARQPLYGPWSRGLKIDVRMDRERGGGTTGVAWTAPGMWLEVDWADCGGGCCAAVPRTEHPGSRCWGP